MKRMQQCVKNAFFSNRNFFTFESRNLRSLESYAMVPLATSRRSSSPASSSPDSICAAGRLDLSHSNKNTSVDIF